MNEVKKDGGGVIETTADGEQCPELLFGMVLGRNREFLHVLLLDVLHESLLHLVLLLILDLLSLPPPVGTSVVEVNHPRSLWTSERVEDFWLA
mmetsp:Transcript_5859/g.11569  ORF Transcript_5859/g.11569 Transcript_5859/m.11569 type:complete len:93 (-) Transcript_5859:1643-1921(-)